jgi:peptidyl-prolyl cis-trans isomerase C
MPNANDWDKARGPATVWLREPLVQFLLIGVALFFASGAQNHRLDQGAKYDIALTTDDLRQLHNTFAAQWERQPSPEEMRGLVDQRIREEILYREALQLGLEKDDVIVRRRLAQKMQFLSEDVSAAYEPKTAELKVWYGKNNQRFSSPASITFGHLYFSPDRRGAKGRQAAQKVLAKITGQPEDSKTATGLADPFMFQNYYRERSAEQLAKEFGTGFSHAIFQLKPGSWQGPIESGYGWHLVWIESITPGRVPNFEEIESDVKSAWLADQKAQQWQKAYEKMRAKYQVSLPDLPAEPSSARMNPSTEESR